MARTDQAASASQEQAAAGDQGAQAPAKVTKSTTIISSNLDPKVEALLNKTTELTQQLGALSTLALAASNYDLASKALTYARGLIDASNGIVKSLEEAG